MARLKSCMACGKIHATDHKCDEIKKKDNERSKRYKDKKVGDLRNTYRWRKKRESIKQRDNYLCVVCKRNFLENKGKIGFGTIEVHHIIPYRENEELFFDDDNLITLCKKHHEEAEANKIPRMYLRSLIKI